MDGKHLDCKKALPHNLAKIPGLSQSDRKVFVGGLPNTVFDEELKNYFITYGEIESCMVIKDKEDHTRNRGFGFVTFKHASTADEVCGEHRHVPHYIGNKRVTCSKSLPKNALPIKRVAGDGAPGGVGGVACGRVTGAVQSNANSAGIFASHLLSPLFGTRCVDFETK